MRASAIAQPNIALIKYWGKRDADRNLPAVGSQSITLGSLWTTMDVEFSAEWSSDRLTVNGSDSPSMLPRLSACLDRIAGPDRQPANIISECNFPIAAGLASSASSFAALVVAADAALAQGNDTLTLARSAGAASGSAARSLYPGFVELRAGVDEIDLEQLALPADWPLLLRSNGTAPITDSIPGMFGCGSTTFRSTSPEPPRSLG